MRSEKYRKAEQAREKRRDQVCEKARSERVHGGEGAQSECAPGEEKRSEAYRYAFPAPRVVFTPSVPHQLSRRSGSGSVDNRSATLENS